MVMQNLSIVLLTALFLSSCGVFEGQDSFFASPPQQLDSEEYVRQMYSSEDERVYEERFQSFLNAFQTGRAEGIYDTLEDVQGSEKYREIRRLADSTIAADSLEVAVDYAIANNSSALIVYREGNIEREYYRPGVDKKTLLNSKSLAKPLGVVAVGAAISKGFIDSLDQPVADFIQEWKGKPQAKILVRHLLDMRTGLLPQAEANSPDDILNRAYLHPRHDEIIVNEYPMTHEVGERYEYSNANSELVAVLIERSTGKKYQNWVSEEILKPIGALGGTVWLNRQEGTAHSGCCIQLPAETWLRLAILLMNRGVWSEQVILQPEFVDAMLTPTEQNRFYGMGVWLGSEFAEFRGFANPDVKIGLRYHSAPYLADDIFMFDGNANQIVYIVPSEDLVILRLGSRPPQEPVWDNAYLPNVILSSILEE